MLRKPAIWDHPSAMRGQMSSSEPRTGGEDGKQGQGQVEPGAFSQRDLGQDSLAKMAKAQANHAGPRALTLASFSKCCWQSFRRHVCDVELRLKGAAAGQSGNLPRRARGALWSAHLRRGEGCARPLRPQAGSGGLSLGRRAAAETRQVGQTILPPRA